jgi:hypothetical protein
MTLSKDVLIQQAKLRYDREKKFEEADLSFMVNISTMTQLANAYKKSFNLLAQKKITPRGLKDILECLAEYLKIIEKMEITVVVNEIESLKTSAREICTTHSLPPNIREGVNDVVVKPNLDFYESAMKRIQDSNDES